MEDILQNPRFKAAAPEAKKRILTQYHQRQRTEMKQTDVAARGMLPPGIHEVTEFARRAGNTLIGMPGAIAGALFAPQTPEEKAAPAATRVLTTAPGAGRAGARLVGGVAEQVGQAIWPPTPRTGAQRVLGSVMGVPPEVAEQVKTDPSGALFGAAGALAPWLALPKVTGGAARLPGRIGAWAFGPMERTKAFFRLEKGLTDNPAITTARDPTMPGQKPIKVVPRLEGDATVKGDAVTHSGGSVGEIAEAGRKLKIDLDKEGHEGTMRAADLAKADTWKFAEQRLGPIMDEALVRLDPTKVLPSFGRVYKQLKVDLPQDAANLLRIAKEIAAKRPISIRDARWTQDIFDNNLQGLYAETPGLRAVAEKHPSTRAQLATRKAIGDEVVRTADERSKPAQLGQILKTWGNIKEVYLDARARLVEYAAAESVPWYMRVPPGEVYSGIRSMAGSVLHGAITLARELSGKNYKASTKMVNSAWRALKDERSKLLPVTGPTITGPTTAPSAPPTAPLGPTAAPQAGPQATPPAPATPPAMRPLSPQAQAQARVAASSAEQRGTPSTGPAPMGSPAAGMPPGDEAIRTPPPGPPTGLPSGTTRPSQTTIEEIKSDPVLALQQKTKLLEQLREEVHKGRMTPKQAFEALRNSGTTVTPPAPAAAKPITVYRSGDPNKPGYWYAESSETADLYRGTKQRLTIQPRQPLDLNTESGARILSDAIRQTSGEVWEPQEIRQGIAHIPIEAQVELRRQGFDWATIVGMEKDVAGRLWIRLNEGGTAAAKPTGVVPTLPDLHKAVDWVLMEGTPLKAGEKPPGRALKSIRDEAAGLPDEIKARLRDRTQFWTREQRGGERLRRRRASGEALGSTTVSIEAAGGVESKVIAGKVPTVASPEEALIGEETAVNRAAELIRGGQSVKAVFSALTDGLGRQLKPKEIDVLTKAILEVGKGKGPKGEPGVGPGETPRPEAKWLSSLTREEARTAPERQGLSTPEQKAKVISALETAVHTFEQQRKASDYSFPAGTVKDFLVSKRAKATLTPEGRNAEVRFFYDPAPGAPFGFEIGGGVYVNKVLLEMGKGVSPTIEVIAHEAAHVMREVKGKGFPTKLPYLERPHEKSAMKYAKFIVPGKGIWFFAPAAIGAAMQALRTQREE